MQFPSGQRDKHQGIRFTIPAAGLALLVSWFLPPREISNKIRSPTAQYTCKNSCHRDAAATAHTAER